MSLSAALLLSRTARLHADRPALATGTRVIASHADFVARLARLAGGLAARLRSGERVGLVMAKLAASALAPVLLCACSPSTRKLDEAVIHEGPQFRLKLVRYHGNLPFHYTGEVFRVQCSSPQTTNSPSGSTATTSSSTSKHWSGSGTG